MEHQQQSTTNSIEMQIDNFLEQFRTAASLDNSILNLTRSRSRASCFEVSDESTDVPTTTVVNNDSSTTTPLPIPQSHIFQHQSSVASSCASVQTVLLQNLDSSSTTSINSSSLFMSANYSSSSSTYSNNTNLNGTILPVTMFQSHHYCGGGGSVEPLTISDVADLLHPQYAIISGGKSIEGCPLITFPDHNNFHTLSDLDYQKLIYYLTSVPSLQDTDLGFNLIIDRRKDRWASVKVSSKFFKDEFRFRLVVCASMDELYLHIPRSQLTIDLGGELTYSHHEWIQQRISLEKFANLTQQVSSNLDRFIKIIHETEFPNSVEATQKLLDLQGGEYEKLKDEILAAAKHGEGILEEIKAKDELGREFSERTGTISSIESAGSFIVSNRAYDDIRDYRRLLVQMEETERQFDAFWNIHLKRLKQCLELRRFEQDFRELQTNFENHLKVVSDMTEIGETVARCDTLIKDTKAYQRQINMDTERAEEVITIGQQLIQSGAACPKEVIQPKCDELSRVKEIVSERLSKRLDILTKSRDLMDRIEKANKWCAKGVELLASQNTHTTSAEIAEQQLQQIVKFLASAEFLSSPRDFHAVFEESMTTETKPLVTQVLQRLEDVSLMCDKRIVSLKKLTLKPPRPVQTVIPEPAVPILQPPQIRPRKGMVHKIDGLDSRPRSMEGPPDSGISLSGDTTNSDNPNCSQSDETCRLKRGHVLAELLETERIYVAEMGSILKGYRDQIFSEEMASLVPPGLQGKEDVLFGNLNELHSFHSDVFLKDLENCISTTELVALCFVQRRDTFYRLYSYYCQNIPRSEQLRETLVDTHLFLQECQKRLGHKLPLAAYLLKPVQRITKYQLLLKDLLRFSDNGTCAKELQKALDCMLIVLKCVNDSMHQIAITGFPADLDHQGELLLQDSFQVWTDSKKDLRLRLKTQQRHIFLYQKAMLFCKQASKTGHNKSTYQYKHYVKMSQIGLTESVRGDPRKFEVWLQGRLEVHTIQAATVEIKNKWVTEIKRVLLNQLEELKGEKIKQYGLNQKPLKHATSWEASVSITSLPQRAVSVDVGHDHKISSHHINVSNLEAIHNLPPAISSSSSEMDNQETGAWSSDYSNSEDEYTHIEDGVCVAPGGKFVALADYCAMGNSEVTMKEGDMVELVKVGCAGWWFVKVLGGSVEGWAPAAYLESLNRRPTRNRRSQDRLNDY